MDDSLSANLLKSNHRTSAARSIDRGPAPCTELFWTTRKARGPDPFGIRASEDRARRVGLYDSLSRIHDAVVRNKSLRWQSEREQAGTAPAHRPHRCGTRERTPTHDRRGTGDGVPGFHSDALMTAMPSKRINPFGRFDVTVKSLYSPVNPLRQCVGDLPFEAVISRTRYLTNPTVTRRRNALALFHAYAERALAEGATPKGLEQAFAASLQISPSMWSQIKSARSIGDKLARQFEVLCRKPRGWMDENHEPASITPAEKAFLDLALRAWRATNSKGRRNLRAHLAAIASGVPPADPEQTSLKEARV